MEKSDPLFKKYQKKLSHTFNSPGKYFKSKQDCIEKIKYQQVNRVYGGYEYTILSFLIDQKCEARDIDFSNIHNHPLVIKFLTKFFDTF